MNKRSGTHIRDGALLAVFLIVLAVIYHLTGVYGNNYLSYLIYPLIVIAVIFFCFNYAKRTGNARFSDVFGYGFKAICVTALIMVAWNILASQVIFPEHTTRLIAERQKELIEVGVPREEVEQQFSFSKKYFNVLTISSTLFMYAISGIVGALLAASLVKKNNAYDQTEIK